MSKSNYKSYEKMLQYFLSGKAECVTGEKIIEGIQQGIVEEVCVLHIRPTANGFVIVEDNANKKRGL